MFVVNVAFSLVVAILLTLLVTEAECNVARGHMLADAEIAVGRTSVWTAPALPPHSHLR